MTQLKVYGELVEVDGEEMLLEEVDEMNIDEAEYEQVPGNLLYIIKFQLRCSSCE